MAHHVGMNWGAIAFAAVVGGVILAVVQLGILPWFRARTGYVSPFGYMVLDALLQVGGVGTAVDAASRLEGLYGPPIDEAQYRPEYVVRELRGALTQVGLVERAERGAIPLQVLYRLTEAGERVARGAHFKRAQLTASPT